MTDVPSDEFFVRKLGPGRYLGHAFTDLNGSAVQIVRHMCEAKRYKTIADARVDFDGPILRVRVFSEVVND